MAVVLYLRPAGLFPAKGRYVMADLAMPASAQAHVPRPYGGYALPAAMLLLFAIVPLFAAFNAEAYVLGLFTRVMIFAIAALALDLLVGYGALVSFGHAAFIGLGAYAVGILASHGISELLISLPVALIASALFAWRTGVVCLRTQAASTSS